MTVDLDYYVNVAELMTDIDIDRAENIDELPITHVSGSDVVYEDSND